MRLAVIAILVGLCSVAGAAQDFRLGAKVNGFVLQDLHGQDLVYSPGAVTAVVFFSTTCPVSNAYNDRLASLYREYSVKGVRFLFVDANANESAEDVAKLAREAGWTFPLYKDHRNVVADRFGAMATPETFVIDAGGVLRYHGYVDDSRNEARVRSRGLKTAIQAVLAGNAVPIPQTKAFGCTIKRVRRIS